MSLTERKPVMLPPCATSLLFGCAAFQTIGKWDDILYLLQQLFELFPGQWNTNISRGGGGGFQIIPNHILMKWKATPDSLCVMLILYVLYEQRSNSRNWCVSKLLYLETIRCSGVSPHPRYLLNLLSYGRCSCNFKSVIQRYISWVFTVQFLSQVCHNTLMLVSQYWFNWRLGTIR